MDIREDRKTIEYEYMYSSLSMIYDEQFTSGQEEVAKFCLYTSTCMSQVDFH